RDVVPGQIDSARVHQEGSGHGIEQRRFSRTIGADDDEKRAGLQLERDIAQRAHLIWSAGKEDFAEMVEFQHARGTRAYLTFWEVAKRPRDGSRWASYVFSVVGTSRCDVPARVRAGGTNRAGRGVA